MKHADVVALAKELRDTAALSQEPFLSAIAEHHGLVPDMIWDAKRGVHGEYVLAGEYIDVPRRMLTMPDLSTFRGVRVDGNADEIADTLRAQGMDVTDDDVRAFARDYRKLTIADFIDEAREIITGGDDSIDSSLMDTEDVLTRCGFFFDGYYSDGMRRYVRDESRIEVALGTNALSIRGAELPKTLRRSPSGAWVMLPARDLRAISITIASALVNEIAA
jgi:hypothetical protein